MKKLTALLLAGAMALSLTACGGGGGSSTSTPRTSTCGIYFKSCVRKRSSCSLEYPVNPGNITNSDSR